MLFHGTIHLTNVCMNFMNELYVRSTYLSLLHFWACFLGERVGGRSRSLPTPLHICKWLAPMEPVRKLLQGEERRIQPTTALPTAAD